jgi:hypothetical protein
MNKFLQGPDDRSHESRIKFRRRKFFIAIQMFTTVVFTAWLLIVWIKGSHFGSQPECNHLVKYVLVFKQVRATETWLRAMFITYLLIFSCVLSYRFISIFSVCVDDFFGRQIVRRDWMKNAYLQTGFYFG